MPRRLALRKLAVLLVFFEHRTHLWWLDAQDRTLRCHCTLRGWFLWWPDSTVVRIGRIRSFIFITSGFRILGITFSSELQFWWSWIFWKANEKLYSFELVSCQFEQIQDHETIPIHPPLCLSFSGFNFVCVFVFGLLLLVSWTFLVFISLQHIFKCLVWGVDHLDHHIAYVQVHFASFELYP